MNKVHNYFTLDSRQKSRQDTNDAHTTQQKLSRALGKSRSSINTSAAFSIPMQIAKYKSHYLTNLEAYYGMKFVEYLGDLIKQFEELYLQMLDSLSQMLFLIKQIDFNAPNFDELYQTDAEYLSETIFRDIKYLETQHSELVNQSGLRYLNTLLEVLEIDFQPDFQEFDIKDWAQNGLDHIFKYNSNTQKKKYRLQQRPKTLSELLCCCFIKKQR